jgi:aminoglycoside 6'-N-acetyltransferase
MPAPHARNWRIIHEAPGVSGSDWPAKYEIRVEEALNGHWSTWFEGLEIQRVMGQTVLSGSLPDQSALHGVLEKVRDLGLHLVAVCRVGDEQRETATTVDGMILQGERMLMRRGRPDDVETLARIRREPKVARWWGDFEPDELHREFVDSPDGFVIEVDGEIVGGIQYSEEDEPLYRHAAIDVFVTSSRHALGFGSDAIRTLARYLFDERGHHRLTIDPATSNVTAIRAYERVGFRKVGVMRQYERGPDGSWRDGLLMDMLRGELTSRATGGDHV